LGETQVGGLEEWKNIEGEPGAMPSEFFQGQVFDTRGAIEDRLDKKSDKIRPAFLMYYPTFGITL
jgi:hypothetical protein